VCDDDAFSCGEAIGLQDHRIPEACERHAGVVG
jgi:hypothetical protein